MSQTNSKETIMDAALTLFMEKGYSATGIAEIVQNAGVTKPTLYYFFNSKEELFSAILDTYYTRLLVAIRETARYTHEIPVYYDNDIVPILRNTARVYFSFAQENTNFYLLVLSMQYANPGGDITAIVRRYQEEEQKILLSMFTSMSHAHGNLQGKEELMSVNFLAMLQNAVGLWHNKGYPLDEERINLTVRLFMHGIFA